MNTVAANAAPAATNAATTPAAAVAPRAPSKKKLADAIFATKLADLKAGVFTTNKDFRAAVINTIIADLGVSVASAATMYNSAKVEAEATDSTVVLGRDPKKEKPVTDGKRGRKAKAAPVADVVTVDTSAVTTAEATPEVAAAPVEVTADATV